MTETTYTITTKPRENGNKLAITVEAREDGVLVGRLTKVTGRTYPYIVVEVGFASTQWNGKTREIDHGRFLYANVVKGTKNHAVAEKAFSYELSSLRKDNGAAFILARPPHDVRNGSIYAPAQYKVWRASSKINTTIAQGA